jgi:hypothetical protein
MLFLLNKTIMKLPIIIIFKKDTLQRKAYNLFLPTTYSYLQLILTYNLFLPTTYS